MLNQVTVPKTPEEFAACLAKMTREDRRFVEGVIVALDATQQQRTTGNNERQPVQA